MSTGRPLDALPQGYGQVAYDAYLNASNGKSLISGAPLPQWFEQAPEIRDAWDAAAAAVIKYISRISG